MRFTICDLRQCPEFFDTVAERIWRAWWKPDGHPLAYVEGRLRENLDAASIPFALVAHEGKAFLGTVSAIASDVPERGQFTPWVAAVWVEPLARQRGIGAALVNRAAQDCFALGFPRRLMRATATVRLLRKPRLDRDRTECRAAQAQRVAPGGGFRIRRSQELAAMKTDRPNPVRWCNA
jgi:GNAT superfamily N-acetyltransferase